MVAPEEHAERERRKSIRRDQPDCLRPQKRIVPAVAQDEDQLGRGELHEDHAEDQEKPRAAQKRRRLIDPKLGQRRGEKEKRDDKILRRLRLLAAEDQKRDARR